MSFRHRGGAHSAASARPLVRLARVRTPGHDLPGGQKAAGGILGLLLGGALISVSPALLFILTAALLPTLAVPTIAVIQRRKRRGHRADASDSPEPTSGSGVGSLLDVLRLPGARLVLLAQVLWVAAYVALPTFFVVAMRKTFDATPLESALGIAAIGVLSGGALLAAGRTPPRLVSGLRLVGAVLLGTGQSRRRHPDRGLARDRGHEPSDSSWSQTVSRALCAERRLSASRLFKGGLRRLASVSAGRPRLRVVDRKAAATAIREKRSSQREASVDVQKQR